MDIRVSIRTLDRHSESRRFKTLKGAQRYAHSKVGAHPDLGSSYAVDMYGVVTLRVSGTTLRELFPEEKIDLTETELEEKYSRFDNT